MIKKMNWGYGIMFAIIAFIIAMFGMVYTASLQTNEMMDERYYEKELRHQSKIDASRNFGKLNIETSFFKTTNDSIIIQLPTMTISDLKNGSLEFVNWASKKEDQKFPIQIDATGKIGLAKATIAKGNYTVRLYWENNNVAYYKEQPFLYL